MTETTPISKVTGVNGNMVSVEFAGAVMQNEVAYVLPADGSKLKSEVIRVRGREADLQVFESTTGVKVGDPVEFTSQLLSVELGPGLLTQVYDGLQNPLPELAKQAGYFLKKGLYVYPLDREKKWSYTPVAKIGARVQAGDTIGTVPEGIFKHRIMVPFAWTGEWTVIWTIEPGDYTIDTVVAKVSDGLNEREITMVQTWPVKIPITAYDDKLQTLSDSMEEMVGKLNDQIELTHREQARLRSMELSLLQAQINPHFLYNTLDAIVWLVETKKNDQAVEMVSSLSNYFRSFLSNGKEIILLSEELQHVKSYLEIQQFRYQDILRYSIDIDPTIENSSIPKMTLQPLVENAIYHGIKPKRGIGTILVKGEMQGDKVVLTVSDTGVGMSPETRAKILRSLGSNEPPGFGVFAAWQRLKLTFGDDFTFDIESEVDSGTTFRIVLPYCPAEEEHI